MIYLDTSALIKRYIWESGAEQVRHLFRDNSPIATSKIAYTEVFAALTRRKREGHFTRIRYNQVCRLFEREWPAYLIIEFHDVVLRLSRELIKRYPLRSLDAIHLASAKSLKQDLKRAITFVCADERLLNCARLQGFKLFDLS